MKGIITLSINDHQVDFDFEEIPDSDPTKYREILNEFADLCLERRDRR